MVKPKDRHKLSKIFFLLSLGLFLAGFMLTYLTINLKFLGAVGLLLTYFLYGIERFGRNNDALQFTIWMAPPILTLIVILNYFGEIVTFFAYVLIISTGYANYWYYRKGKRAYIPIIGVLGSIGIVFFILSSSSTSLFLDPAQSDIQGKSTEVQLSEKMLAMEFAIYEGTNRERIKKGKTTLVWDNDLAIIAREHSNDMVKNNFYDHKNLKGEDPSDRAIKYGYNVKKKLAGGWYSNGIAENIMQMPTGDVQGMGYVSNNVDSVSQAIVKGWMNSPGHRENILSSDYSNVGIGIAYDGKYYFATQDFW
jgi:uncharacterized protein YkwD